MCFLRDLFAGAEWSWITDVEFERYNTLFRGEIVVFFSFAKPQWAQSHGVHAEYTFVLVTRDKANRTLRKRPPTDPVTVIERLLFGRQGLRFRRHRREHDLHGFQQRKTVDMDQRFQRTVQILRVGAAMWKLSAKHPRFL